MFQVKYRKVFAVIRGFLKKKCRCFGGIDRTMVYGSEVDH